MWTGDRCLPVCSAVTERELFLERIGLIDHGWMYVNLDDGWERAPRETDPLYEGPTRATDGTMLTNKKFPDMKALGDYIHSKGLRFGIYSGPGPTTCQGLEASWQHELQDFQTFAKWGVDYIKYDWCAYSEVAPKQPSLEDVFLAVIGADSGEVAVFTDSGSRHNLATHGTGIYRIDTGMPRSARLVTP